VSVAARVEENRFGVLTLGLLIAVVPVAAWWLLPRLPSLAPSSQTPSNGSTFPPSVQVFHRQSLGDEANPPPWITHTQIVDVNGDGLQDVLGCDARWNRVVCHYQRSSGGWQAEVLGTDLIAPAHATVVDLDGDGHRDVVVSVLGNIWPDDGVLGRVVWLRWTETGFSPQVLLTDVRRVADAQPGDFDNDGDIDLVVAVFGYARGEVLWFEHHPGHRFEPHPLLAAAGAIHVPVADFDGDGDLDFATVVSQDDEEVWGFENQGQGQFLRRRLFGSLNDDLGSAGLVLTDLDRDGDPDLLLPVGDNLEDIHSYPQAYHGCFWLENRGGWEFRAQRIASFGGTYAAAPGDVDGDADVDVVLVSMFNDWDRPGHASIIWLENDGAQRFTPWQIDTHPQHLVTVACGDLNGDGRHDIVAGMMRLLGPYSSNSGINIWLSADRSAP
jgi:ketosteroid isomerase-like protein